MTDDEFDARYGALKAAHRFGRLQFL